MAKKEPLQPENFELETNTVWAFPDRGKWATHDAKYRGNWSPYIPRNIILRYSSESDKVLDQFVGGDTKADISVSVGDARKLDIPDGSIDLICTHPPYADIINYSDGIEGDLSLLSIKPFLAEMGKVAEECFRVLKKDKFCAILMGDTRKKGMVQPLAFETMRLFELAGFKLKEIIIKEQHNCKATGYWKTSSIKYNFLLLAHEYLFVFKKV